MAPRFSFIIPVYGVERYLSQCVTSILEQTFREFEIFLVDDGSPDRSGEICDSFASSDPRVRAIHQLNAGAAAARNVALPHATGDFVIFVDGDDCLLGPQVLDAVNQALLLHQPDVLVVDHKKYWEGEPRPLPQVMHPEEVHDLAWMMRHDVFVNPPWDKITRRAMLLEHGIEFPVDKRTSDDAVWTSRLLIATSHICHSPIDFYGYLQRSASITASFAPTKLADLQSIFTDGAADLLDLPDGARRAAYGAYFARFYAFLLAATSQHPTAENLEFLQRHRMMLSFAQGRRAKLTRAAVTVIGVRGSVRTAAAIQRARHHRRSRMAES